MQQPPAPPPAHDPQTAERRPWETPRLWRMDAAKAQARPQKSRERLDGLHLS